MQTLLHFARRDDTSGLFWQLAEKHDRAQYRMLFATLEKMDPALRTAVRQRGVPTYDFAASDHNHGDYLRTVMRMARYLRRNRVEILHTHFYFSSLVGLMAGAMAGTPYRVMTRHYSDTHARMGLPLEHEPVLNRHVKLDQFCTKLAHRVIAVSNHTAEFMRDFESAPAGKIRVVDNGLDLDHFKISGSERVLELRREFGGEDRDLIILVSRLHPEKGIDVLYRALPEVKRRSKRPFVLLHAGDGLPEHTEHYRRLLKELDCEDVVQWLGFRCDVPDLMAASDFMVLPSLMEAFGLVVIEALYLGLPVVASHVGGIPEIVDEGRDSLLVPRGDSGAMADAMVDLLDHPQKRQAMRGQGRDKVIQRYSFGKMLHGYENVYAELQMERGGNR